MENAENDIGYFEMDAVFNGKPLEDIVWTGLKEANDNMCNRGLHRPGGPAHMGQARAWN